ncbi:MAG: outer membrane protein assembly factor BamE [Methylophilaceae bacterium]|nr:outer membrane protein assembly factor BamE [Methylophilaceae bacterium]
MHAVIRIFTLLLALATVGCGSSLPAVKSFKMDIQQGNVITSDMLLKLRPGMSKSQVQFIMGTPLLVDSFHTNRWDYFYQFRKQGKIINQHRVILDFEGDSLARVRGDVVPEGTDIDALMQQAGSSIKPDIKVDAPVVADVKEQSADAPLPAPKVEATQAEVIAPETAKVEEAKVEEAKVESLEVAPLEQAVETVKDDVALVRQEAVEQSTPVVEESKKLDLPKKMMIQAPPVVNAKSGVVIAPKQTVIPAPPVIGKQATPDAIKSSAEVARPVLVKPREYKPGEGLLPYEEDPSFFERALEIIGF